MGEMNPVRIACVRYLNTAPLIEGLDKIEGVTLIPTVPSQIVDLLVAGEADVGLASIIDAASSAVPLSLLPCGMIGCDGPTLTVRLFSAVPLDRVTRLHTDADSHTSTVLARVLLAKRYGVKPSVVGFDVRERVQTRGTPAECSLEESWPESVLLIGDKVVADPPPQERYPYQMDLGEAWKEVTGLPFVYAMWMVRTSEAHSASVRGVATLLDRQLRHNFTRLDWIVNNRAPAARWPIPTARRYLTELLRYRVSPRERQAVERFLEMAGELEDLNLRTVQWAWMP